jgi:hypothetical protein
VVVVVVTRGRDRILWQLLPVHIPTTLLIPMPSTSSSSSSSLCSSSSSYWSSCSSWYRLPLTSTSVTHSATLKTSSFPGLSYDAKGIAAVMGETLNHHQKLLPSPHLQFVLLLLPIAASCNKTTYLPSSISLLVYPFSPPLSLAAAVPRARIALQICHRAPLSSRGRRTNALALVELMDEKPNNLVHAAIGPTIRGHRAPRTLAVIKSRDRSPWSWERFLGFMVTVLNQSKDPIK